MNPEKITIITGSSRPNKNSYTFARSIKNIIESKNSEAGIFNVMESFRKHSVEESIIKSLKNSSLLIIITPLYADYLPYPLIWLLEELSENHGKILENKKLFGISQCAFPYWELNKASLNSLRFFAQQCNMRWMGGLGYGGAAFIDGKNLESIGKSGRKLINAFEISMESIFQNEEIPSEAQDLIKIKIPKVFTRPISWLLNRRIKKLCGKHGVQDPAVKSYIL